MTLLDKINTELSALQSELTQLHHYTQEIGRATEASISVIDMSKEFTNSFGSSVDRINDYMRQAADGFKENCDNAAGDLDEARQSFQDNIEQAKRSLDSISSNLRTASENVSDLARRIQDMNILGHFERIHDMNKSHGSSLLKLQEENLSYHEQSRTFRTGLLEEISRNQKRNHEGFTSMEKLQKITIAISIIALIICVVTLALSST